MSREQLGNVADASTIESACTFAEPLRGLALVNYQLLTAGELYLSVSKAFLCGFSVHGFLKAQSHMFFSVFQFKPGPHCCETRLPLTQIRKLVHESG